MDEFRLQRRLFREIIRTRPSVQDGMAAALAAVKEAPHGEAWAACKCADWSRGEARWVRWFNRLLKKRPIPRETELLWFEVPSELNPALTSVSGYAKLTPWHHSFGLEEGRFWPEDDEGYTRNEGLLRLPELDAVFAGVGWGRSGSDEVVERLRPGVYALSYAYAALLVCNGLPRTRLPSRVGVRGGVGVVVGWAEGGPDPIGVLAPAGWRPLRYDPRSIKARPEELDPSSMTLNVGKYLANGGDPNWRERRTGETLLIKCADRFPPEIRRLVAAGADVNAADKQGQSVLHHFGACELPILQLFLDQGADPRTRTADGQTVLDRYVDDGRCTVHHLEVLWKAGARLGKEPGRIPRPIRSLVESGIWAEGTKRQFSRLLRFWLDRGFRLDARDREGRTALWIALECHAAELPERLVWLRENPNSDERLGYRHDAVAIMLLDHGADPNARLVFSRHKAIPAGATPLMVRGYEDERLVKALLKHGADPLARCSKGRTALDYAQRAAADPRRPGTKGAQRVAALLERAMKRAASKRRRR